jgi:hypothetical protein
MYSKAFDYNRGTYVKKNYNDPTSSSNYQFGGGGTNLNDSWAAATVVLRPS